MNASVRHFQNMSRPQNRPNWPLNQSGPYMMGRMWTPSQQLPPSPPSSMPPALPHPPQSRPITPTCPPTMPCPPTQPCSPGTPSISPSQPRSNTTPHSNPPSRHGNNEATRAYGFDLNPQWQEDRDHYDNQKVNSLTLPRSIRQSAFTQKLDIEGCDPLSLPVAALLYQQANNHWLRKLAHGREVYLIPTGDIAAVVFTTELLMQLRNRGINLDKVSHFRTRQDGKLQDKTANTKYAAQQIAEVIQGWLPARTTDPDSQHEITKLRNELAELRQCTGKDLGDTATPPRTGPSASSPASKGPTEQLHKPNATTTTIIRPLMPLVGPATVNPWLTEHTPPTLAVRAFNKWLKDLPISEPNRKVLTENIAKTGTWWSRQPAEALETVERVAVMVGIPVSLLGKNYDYSISFAP